MLQDIAPRLFFSEYRMEAPASEDFVLYFEENTVLLKADGATDGGTDGAASTVLTLPRLSDLPADMSPQAEGTAGFRYLFSIDDQRFFLVDPLAAADKSATPVAVASAAAAAAVAASGFIWQDTFALRKFTPTWMAFAAITAHHLYLWYRGHRFCGRCGAATLHAAAERMVRCPACGELAYPKISPVVIVGIIHGEHLLMTRYARGPYAHFALVAGFVEIGETFEDAVRREVFEETGVRVTALRYYKSQPWGFSSSLLAGYFCDLEGDPTITVDETELAEALWVTRDQIPATENNISLTSEMIELFRAGLEPRFQNGMQIRSPL